jgi:hypothetical protein
LAEEADLERQRREKSARSDEPKVYTNTDLDAGKPQPEGKSPADATRPSPSPRPSPAPVPARPPASVAEPIQAPSEAEWRQRARRLREAVDVAQRRVDSVVKREEELRRQLNPQSLDYPQDTNRLLQLQASLAALAPEREESRRFLEATHQAQEELEAEARLKRIPLEWLSAAD